MKAIEYTNAKRLSKESKLQMVIFLSSIGVTRTKSFPFFILNAFGVLDAKRDAEIAIRKMSEKEGFDYMIVRPGRLVGGPWTNTDVANLLKTEEGNKQQIEVEEGDRLNGDAARWSVAEFIVRGINLWKKAKKNESIGTNTEELKFVNKEITLINRDGEKFQNDSQWEKLFQNL